MEHTTTQKNRLKRLVWLATPVVIGIVFILLTDPYKLPLVFLLIPFLLLAIGLYQILNASLRRLHVSKAKARFVSIVVTSLILLVALLQSIHQLSIKDFLILGALLLGMVFYLRRMEL